jgi:hypothetical protein
MLCREFVDVDMLTDKDCHGYSVAEFKRWLVGWEPRIEASEFYDFVRFEFPWFDGRRALARELKRWYLKEAR